MASEYSIITRIEINGTLREFGALDRVGFSGDGVPALSPVDVRGSDLSGLFVGLAGTPYGFTLDLSSYGKIMVVPTPNVDGEALPSLTGNIQITYSAAPLYMDGVTVTAPDPKISPAYHLALAYGAASRILDEGSEADIALAASYGLEFYRAILKATADQYKGMTKYDDFEPA